MKSSSFVKDGGHKKTVQKKPSKRKYTDDYLDFGFVVSENDNSIPVCLVCSVSLSNEAMVPSKLKRHLEKNHPEYKDRSREYFAKMHLRLRNQSNKLKILCSIPDKALMTSLKIAQLLAKKKKPHTDGENVILPALEIAVGTMINSEAVQKMKSIPLSAETVARRIQDLSNDIDEQLEEHVKNQKEDVLKLWALQIDELTDIGNKAQLLAFLRIIKDDEIKNQYFFCSELKETTTGNDIFKLVNQKVESSGLKWNDCVSVCTDGAPSMQGRKKGFASHILRLNPNIKTVHCMIHREQLMTKALPDKMAKTMSEVIKVVNYVKSNSLRTRIFSSLCEAMDSDHKCLLYHTEVRWLSKGKVLDRVLSLRTEVVSFFAIHSTADFNFLQCELWWLEVMFLNDLFDKLNSLNLSLQGEKENMITINGKLKAFEEKLQLWRQKSRKCRFDFLPNVNGSPNRNQIARDIQETLKNLASSFSEYFPNLNTRENQWVLNPFVTCADFMTATEEESYIDLKNDMVHKVSFGDQELSTFWISLRHEYPELSEKAIKSLLPFGSSYLCELGFSALTEIKSKKRERLLMLDQEMRVCLSGIEPRLEKICSQKQSHPSH